MSRQWLSEYFYTGSHVKLYFFNLTVRLIMLLFLVCIP